MVRQSVLWFRWKAPVRRDGGLHPRLERTGHLRRLVAGSEKDSQDTDNAEFTENPIKERKNRAICEIRAQKVKKQL
jgi:hypothetical protein